MDYFWVLLLLLVISSEARIYNSSNLTLCLKAVMVCQKNFFNDFAPPSVLRLPCVSVPPILSPLSLPSQHCISVTCSSVFGSLVWGGQQIYVAVALVEVCLKKLL